MHPCEAQSHPNWGRTSSNSYSRTYFKLTGELDYASLNQVTVCMKTRNNTIIVTLIALMVLVTFLVGNWFEQMHPNGLTLNKPSEDTPGENISAFGFGASIGLLLSSLLYCLIAAGMLINSKLKNRAAGILPVAVAVIAAIGFTLSYFVDGYFLN